MLMRWMARTARRWVDRLPKSDVGNGRGDVFFWRHDVWKPSVDWAERYGLGGLYLHEFMRSDNDRCLHDHPWWFVTFVFKGGYWEETFDPNIINPYKVKRTWIRPGSIRFRRAEFAHRIVIEPGMKPWSLVLIGRKMRPWGFWTVQGWKAWVKGDSPICETDPAPETGTAVPESVPDVKGYVRGDFRPRLDL